MLSTETETQVARLLKALAEGERTVEISRQVLSDNYDFDAYQVFKALDVEGKNKVCPVNIMNFLRAKGIYCDPCEAQLIVLFYDQDHDGLLSYAEFLDLVQSEKSSKKGNFSNHEDKLSFNIDYSLTKVLEKEVELARELIQKLRNLRCRYDFNCHDIFHAIKDYNCIGPEGIRNFLDKNAVGYLESDVKAIVKRLDFNKDGRVDVCEFHAFLGFPNCSLCCPRIACTCCGLCCCSDCLCDVLCCAHNCVHRSICSPCCSPCKSPRSRREAQRENEGGYERNYLSGRSPNRLSATAEFNRGSRIGSDLGGSIGNYGSNFNCPKKDYGLSSNNFNQSTMYKTNNLTNSPRGNIMDRGTIASGEERKLTSTLSLRLSPERKFSPEKTCLKCCCCPCRCCNVCCCFPCICCRTRCILSPCRSPCRNPCKSPYNSPLKSNYFSNSLSASKLNCPNNFSNGPRGGGVSSNLNSLNSPKKFSSSSINYNPNQYEEEQFNDFLRELMKIEDKIERAKVELALQCDFNCEDAYRIFELNGRGYVTVDDLQSGLGLLGINVTGTEARILMNRFDLQKTGKLNYQDFFDMLVPYEKDYRICVENRCPNSCCPCRCPEVLSFLTRTYLKNVLNLIIESENKLNLMKKGFTTLRLKLTDIFKLIDRIGLGYFNNADFTDYLKCNNLYPSSKEADLLFIRFDRNRNGKIEKYEVKDELDPVW